MIPIQQTYTSTFIKFDSAPINENDYDAKITSGATSISGDITYSNKTVIYVWGTGAYAGQIKINDIEYAGGYDYTTARSFQLTGNYTIYLGVGNTIRPHSGGAAW